MKIILILIATLFLLLSCAKEMRYTTEEIKSFPPTVQEHIRKGEIATGMTFIQVRYAWGAPATVNILPPGENGIERVEWIYKRLGAFKTSLRFSGGKLTEIISTEPGIAK